MAPSGENCDRQVTSSGSWDWRQCLVSPSDKKGNASPGTWFERRFHPEVSSSAPNPALPEVGIQTLRSMSLQKRALASASSGQPSQPKRQRFGSPNQSSDESVNILAPQAYLTDEDVRRVVREELESAVGKPIESYIANSFNVNWMGSLLEETVKKQVREELKSALGKTIESCIANVLNVNRMGSLLEETFKKQVNEALGHADVCSAYLGRAYIKSGETSDARNLQLHFRTKLSLPLFTGRKLKGENSDALYVYLIDVSTGDVVSSGPESNIKLDVCVLEGDFNKDDNEDWTQEEFENYVVKEREGRRPLLIGNRQVVLKEGVGILGELIFTDNSSWNRSKSFRIGLKVASGYCENARIREAKTEAFPVKEHRGESYRKKYPPASHDDVWRLEKIAKDGKSHQRLNDAGIHKVEDFLLQLFRDPEKLRKILGMTEKNWNTLLDHAKTCTPSGKLYAYYLDDARKHGVVLQNTGQLSGLIENGAYFASHRLSTTQKGYADSMVEKAQGNWNKLEEFHGEASFASIQGSFPSGVIGGQTENMNLVERNPPLDCVNAVHEEVACPFVQSTIEGHNGIPAVGLPIQSENISFQSTVQLAGSPFWSPAGYNAMGVNSPSGGDLWMDDLLISISDDDFERNTGTSAVDSFINNCNDHNASGKGIVGWLKIKAVLQWGFFIRRRALRIVDLEEGQN